MEDRKLIKLLGEEIGKRNIIYDKQFTIPQYSNRSRLVTNAFEETAAEIKNKDPSYFWLKGGKVEDLFKKIRNKYCIISRKKFQTEEDKKFLETFSFLKHIVQIRSDKK
ncbi:uncharacterized protein LOC127291337 [Leptopilina boulardi]|uniref:uncharacterized protein LOC127277710 n=1 Tax=Leptopilina boulardi TaxID=63433 RepID=UPI0021F59A9F|nr:uncharacterized protein LOC127277710 [Leptopilina boulardi]XP_051155250.1 uncharacterized protein LOC127277883 [Leptopilina boulardi]XP_051157734.1 uncharacterized protein LOC127279432 [Leptopilina boulardi]XP_051160166.1 uncharacterized protein LOC127280897 [Leptopilina boulardi]XP_051163594.1 uncharacterized protein LOC127283006 [Leptopilina boulardi]XP_051168812.1 uncharacterized protein LOC127286429 [Leptopilina boulardi]XP_051175411.1 uncharacterized protein LOC127290699 [Leptopilina 